MSDLRNDIFSLLKEKKVLKSDYSIDTFKEKLSSSENTDLIYDVLGGGTIPKEEFYHLVNPESSQDAIAQRHNTPLEGMNWFLQAATYIGDNVVAGIEKVSGASINPGSADRASDINQHFAMATEGMFKNSWDYAKTVGLTVVRDSFDSPFTILDKALGIEKKQTANKDESKIMVEKELANSYENIHNTNTKIRNEYIATGKIDPKSTSIMASLMDSAPATVASLALSYFTKSPKASMAMFMVESGGRTGADFYAETAKRKEDGSLIPNTGNVEHGIFGTHIGIIAGLVEGGTGFEHYAAKLGTKLAGKQIAEATAGITKNAMLKKMAYNNLKDYALNSVGEGLEEVVQGGLEQWGKNYLDLRNGYDLNQLKDGFLQGAFGGLILGGGMQTVSFASDYKKTKAIQETVEKVLDKKEKLKQALKTDKNISPEEKKKLEDKLKEEQRLLKLLSEASPEEFGMHASNLVHTVTSSMEIMKRNSEAYTAFMQHKTNLYNAEIEKGYNENTYTNLMESEEEGRLAKLSAESSKRFRTLTEKFREERKNDEEFKKLSDKEQNEVINALAHTHLLNGTDSAEYKKLSEKAKELKSIKDKKQEKKDLTPDDKIEIMKLGKELTKISQEAFDLFNPIHHEMLSQGLTDANILKYSTKEEIDNAQQQIDVYNENQKRVPTIKEDIKPEVMVNKTVDLSKVEESSNPKVNKTKPELQKEAKDLGIVPEKKNKVELQEAIDNKKNEIQSNIYNAGDEEQIVNPEVTSNEEGTITLSDDQLNQLQSLMDAEKNKSNTKIDGSEFGEDGEGNKPISKTDKPQDVFEESDSEFIERRRQYARQEVIDGKGIYAVIGDNTYVSIDNRFTVNSKTGELIKDKKLLEEIKAKGKRYEAKDKSVDTQNTSSDAVEIITNILSKETWNEAATCSGTACYDVSDKIISVLSNNNIKAVKMDVNAQQLDKNGNPASKTGDHRLTVIEYNGEFYIAEIPQPAYLTYDTKNGTIAFKKGIELKSLKPIVYPFSEWINRNKPDNVYYPEIEGIERNIENIKQYIPLLERRVSERLAEVQNSNGKLPFIVKKYNKAKDELDRALNALQSDNTSNLIQSMGKEEKVSLQGSMDVIYTSVGGHLMEIQSNLHELKDGDVLTAEKLPNDIGATNIKTGLVYPYFLRIVGQNGKNYGGIPFGSVADKEISDMIDNGKEVQIHVVKSKLSSFDFTYSAKESIVPIENPISDLNFKTIADYASSLAELQDVNPNLVNLIKTSLGNVQVVSATPETVINSNGDLMGTRKALLSKDNGVYTIYVNMEKTNGREGNSIIHEGLHKFLRDSLDIKGVDNKGNSTYNKEFDLDLRAMVKEIEKQISNTEFYRKNKSDLDRIFDLNSFRRLGLKEDQIANRQAEEFLAHVFSGTSSLRGWMERTSVNVGEDSDTWFGAFKRILLKIFKKRTDSFTYLNYLESIFDYRLNTNISEIMGEVNESLMEESNDDSLTDIEKINKSAETLDNPHVIVDAVGMIAPNELDAIAYVQTLSQGEFESQLFSNEDWLKSSSFSFESEIENNPGKSHITLDKFRKHLAVNMWRRANSMMRVPTIRLKMHGKGEKRFLTVQELGVIHKDKNNVINYGWTEKNKLQERNKQIGRILGQNTELVYIDAVEFYNGSFGDVSKQDNKLLAENLYNKGYLYLGRFADKNTFAAIKLENLEEAKVKLAQLNLLYTQKASQCFQQLFQEFQEGKSKYPISLEEVQKVTNTAGDITNVARALVEDFKLGATIDEDGNLNSVLYNPNFSDTFDLIKIFKRTLDVVEQTATPTEIDEAIDKLDEKSGIVVNGKGEVDVRTAIFDAKNSSAKQTVTIGDREIEFNLMDILINELGTETTDGVVISRRDGFNKFYREIHAELYDTPVKAIITNNSKGDFSTPFLGKMAIHTTNSDALEAWMRENNIALLMSSSAVKVNLDLNKINDNGEKGSIGYANSDLLGIAQTFNIPLNNIYRQGQKKGVKDNAKGLAQSFTSNLTVGENEIFFDNGGIKQFIDELLSSLVESFEKDMGNLDETKLIKELIRLSRESTNPLTSSLANIAVQSVLLEGDINLINKLNDIKDVDNVVKQDNYLEITKLLKKRGMETSGIFYSPMFSDFVSSYIKESLSKIYTFKAPASWVVLSPDLGFLEETNIQGIFDHIQKEKFPLRKSIDKLNNTIKELNDEKEKLASYLDGSKSDKFILDAIDDINESIKKNEGWLEKTSKVEDVDKMNKETWKELEKIIDVKNGRLKEGYGLISKEYYEKFPILKRMNKAIVTAVPSDGISAQQGVYLFPIETGDENIIKLNSEHTQSKVGKDFDIDVMNILFPDARYFSNDAFNKYFDSINGSNKNLDKVSAKVYGKVLGKKFKNEDGSIDLKDLYSMKTRLEFMQKLFGEKKQSKEVEDLLFGRKVFSLIHDSSPLLDKFQKLIGIAINMRKVLTIKSELGMQSQIGGVDVGTGDITLAYLALMVYTNDMVDIPTNTNGLFYSLTPAKLYAKIYGISKESAEIAYAVDNALFRYAYQISSQRNVDSFTDDYSLSDTIKYIKNQKKINTAISNSDLSTLTSFVMKEVAESLDEKLTAEQENLVYEYLDNARFSNSVMDSAALKSVELIDTSIIRNFDVSPKQNQSWNRDIMYAFANNSKHIPIEVREMIALINEKTKKLVDEKSPYLEGYNFLASELVKTTDQEYNAKIDRAKAINTKVELAMLTSIDDTLDWARWVVAAYLNPVSMTNNQYANNKDGKINVIKLNMKANRFGIQQALPGLMLKAINRELVPNENAKVGQSVSVRIDGVTIKFELTKYNKISITYEGKAVKHYYRNTLELQESARKGDRIANLLLTKADTVALKNEYALSNLIDFKKSTSGEDKFELASNYLNKLIKERAIDRDGATLLFISLVGGTSEGSSFMFNLDHEKINENDSPTNKTLLRLAANTRYGRDFLQAFASISTESFNDSGIGTSTRVSRSIQESNDIEVWEEDGKIDEGNKYIADNITVNNYEDLGSFLREDYIYNIIRDSKVFIDDDNPLFSVFNFNTGNEDVLTANSVYNSTIFRPIKFPKNRDKVKLENLYLTKMEEINKLHKSMETNQIVINRNISLRLDAVMDHPSGLVAKAVNFITKRRQQKIEKETFTKNVIRLVEENPLNISVKTTYKNGMYSYTFALTNSKKERVSDINESELENVIGNEINKLKNPKEYHTMLASIEFMKMNALEVRYKTNLSGFIDRYVNSYRNFSHSEIVESIAEKYRRIVSAKPYSYPHYYTKEAILEVLKKNVDSKYKKNTEEEKANLVKKLFDKLTRVGEYYNGNDVFDKDKLYIQDSFVPHQLASNKLFTSLKSDLTSLYWLEYETEAINRGQDKIIVNRMKQHFAMNAGYTMLSKENKSISKVKKDDMISFYTYGQKSDEKINLIVEKKTDNGIFGKIDKEVYLNTLNMKIKYYDMLLDKGYDVIVTEELLYYYKELYAKGIINIPNPPKSGKDLLYAVSSGLKIEVSDEQLLGSYLTSRIFIKQRDSKGNFINIKGVESTKKNTIWDKLATIWLTAMSGSILGTIVPAISNYIDGYWSLMNTLGKTTMLKASLYGGKLSDVNLVKAAKNIINEPTSQGGFKEYMELADTPINSVNIEDRMEVKKLIKAHVIRYALQEGLVSLSSLESKDRRVMQQILENGVQSADFEKALAILTKITGVLTSPFAKAEQTIRLKAAYSFAFKAIVLDGKTNSNQIRTEIENGVALTQGLYGQLYRRTQERHSAGKVAMQFHQYTAFQKIVFKSDKELMKELNQTWANIWRVDGKSPIAAFFKGGTVNGEINMARTRARRYAYDYTIGVGLMTLFPGMRVGNPLIRVSIMALRMLLTALVNGNDPEPKEVKSLLFAFVSLFAGLGISLPTFMVYNIINDEDNIVDLHPRATSIMMNIWDMIDRDTAKNNRSEILQSNKDWAKVEKSFIFGFNLFAANYFTYGTKEQEDWARRNIVSKITYQFEDMPKNTISTVGEFVPILNLINEKRIEKYKGY